MRTLLIILVLISSVCASDQIPAPPQSQAILIKGAILHTVSNGNMAGDILFDDGRIVALGNEVTAPADALVIQASGKHVYPGMILAETELGLTEIGAIRMTEDLVETGELNPNIIANVAWNPDSEIIPVTRSNGVLLGNAVPESGLIAGQSALMMLDGWTWEDATLKAPTALHLNWPNMRIKPKQAENVTELRAKRLDALRDVDDLIDKVRAYALEQTRDRPPRHDLRLESMIPYVEGRMPITVHAVSVEQIEAAVLWAAAQELKIQISGGADAWMVTDLLKEHNIPVIITSTLRLPPRRYSDYDQTYKLAAQLHAAGIEFCISAPAASNVRNLPYHAAMAASYGLDPEVALEAITLAPARILGVADQVGSLDIGKDATLFIADGNIMDIRTQVEQCYIQGRTLDMTDRQKDLYEKYQTKYRQKGILK